LFIYYLLKSVINRFLYPFNVLTWVLSEKSALPPIEKVNVNDYKQTYGTFECPDCGRSTHNGDNIYDAGGFAKIVQQTIN